LTCGQIFLKSVVRQRKITEMDTTKNMLEIRRGIATRHYENSFFREFAKNLKNLFDKYNIDGLVIANSECTVDERLQIDALLITKHAVCIIDFKNFSGKIFLPDSDNFFNGIWTNESGDRIKGGSSINPYKQLSIQKKKFLSNSKRNIVGIYEKYIQENLHKDDKFNPRHILRIVCFQDKIEIIGEIPQRDKIDFFIVDKTNYIETIKDIVDINDSEVNISQKSYEVFKEVFKANLFDLNENYEEQNIPINKDISQIKINNLYQDQNIAYNEITNFLNSEEKNIFILDGSTNSGKSYLIPYIEELAFKVGFQEVKSLVQSKRIANNLTSENIKFESMYSYIYGGNPSIEEKQDVQLDFKIIPLKHNDDEEQTLYIVDEAQLINDSYYKSIDIQFGSGHLLKDFIEYTNLKNSKRKIVFIGDIYQLSLGSKKEVSLNFEYLEKQYKLQTAMISLVDKPNYSVLTNESLRLVNGIRKQNFNNLNFEFSANLQTVEKEDSLQYIKQNLENNLKVLVYSNADAQKVNLWIKKFILKNGDDITKDDLIIFNNNISIENKEDPFMQPQKIFNGEFATVMQVSNNVISETITPKGKNSVVLKFREIEIRLENGQYATFLSFENFRLNSKNELSDEEIIAYQILLNQCIKEEENKFPFEKSNYYNDLQNNKEYKHLKNKIAELSEQLKNGEKVKTKKEEKERNLRKIEKNAKKDYKNYIQQKLYKDTSSKYFKYKNSAWIKFGWALTVHKAISYKFDNVLINTDQGENRGITNEDYFRWLYTATTRANKKVTLINYKEISPFFTVKNKKNIKISNIDRRDFYYIASNDKSIQNNNIANKYNFPDEKYFLIDFYNFIVSKTQNKLMISEVEHKNWQEVYHFHNQEKQAIVQFYYNRNYQFRKPQIISYSDETFKQQIEDLLLNDTSLNNFDFITSSMKDIYIDMQHILNENNIYISYIISRPYKDEIKFFNEAESILGEFTYNGDGFFTKIEFFAQEENNLANTLKETLENL